MKIFKYQIETTDEQTVAMPMGAQILTVQTQDEKPRIWALVDEMAPSVKRVIRTSGTGHPVPADQGQYVGTYQLRGGALVFHVFAS